MAKTNTGLVEYAKVQLDKPYWYGTFGNTATESLLNSKTKQYPSHYTSGRMSKYKSQLGQRVHDCVGLIKGYLWSDNATATPKYNSSQDVSANGMLSKCTEKGVISTIPELAGVLVFMSGHVGVYIGNGYVIEARGFNYGVVKTKLADRPWTNWGKCPWITYTNTTTATTTASSTTDTKTVKAMAAAQSYSKSLAGTYKVTATSLNVRNGAGTSNKILVTIPKGTQVKCYGYYTLVSGVKWLYVQFTYNGITYTGFASSKYLAK